MGTCGQYCSQLESCVTGLAGLETCEWGDTGVRNTGALVVARKNGEALIIFFFGGG